MHSAMQLEIHKVTGRDVKVPESSWRHSESEA